MRKVFLTLLLAGAAASPALAQDYQSNHERPTRAERQQAREDRQAAREEARPEARPSRDFSRPAQGDFNRPSRPAEFAQPQAPQAPRPDRNFVRQQQAPNGYAGNAADWRAQQRDNRQLQQQQMRDNRQVQQQERVNALRDRVQQRQDFRQNRPPLVNGRPPVSNTPRFGTQPPARTQGYAQQRPTTSWSTMWRVKPQYDWRNYRDRHRSHFHLGFYYDPFGWGYQRYNIGWRMWPSYYGNQFWINNPWDYRLPYAPPGTHWVRYYNDAILVDEWSGEVVDVIYDFFW